MGTLLDDFGAAPPDWATTNPFSSGSLSAAPTLPNVTPKSNMLSTMGTFMALMGGINSAIGTFYAAKSQQYQAKSQALNFQFQSDMASINARQAEYSAEGTLEAGKSQIAQYTMQAGQQKAAATASMAGRGIVLGQGSAQDVTASMDLVKSIDTLTINSNAVRAAEAQRMQSVNFKNESLLANNSAVNANLSAKSISPFAAGMTSLLGAATSYAQNWNMQERIKQYGYPYGGGLASPIY